MRIKVIILILQILNNNVLILKTKKEYNAHISELNPSTIGFVPTMGALHDGHMSLIQSSVDTCDITVVSIFVNPTQFNNAQDLSNYPRTLEDDYKVINQKFPEVIVFAPEVNEIYPKGLKSKRFDFGELSSFMEGKHRKGHFNGVGTVLEKLFSIIKPTKAFFGEKDFQQLMVVKKLVKILHLDVEIIGCSTFREDNGLAKSSRNKLLTEQQRQKAGLIYECLSFVKDNFEKYSISELKEKVQLKFHNFKEFTLEYFEIASEQDLKPILEKQENTKYRGFIAAFYNNVRLIDNLALN